MADELELAGKKYIRYGTKWTDTDNMVVSLSLQSELNALYSKKINISESKLNDLISNGDRFKDGLYLRRLSYG